MNPLSEKEIIQRYWEEHPCGEGYARGDSLRERLIASARARYDLEPYIHEFAHFAEAAGRDVLEIGVGLGADHAEWAKGSPRTLVGIDLTTRGIDYTRLRFELFDLRSKLLVADAEVLPFAGESFDIVYSWGVLHHTPKTEDTIREVARVLRPGGLARIMIYHRYSLVGAMLWLRYALFAGRPRTTLDHLYARHLESPGTKAYSVGQAKRMFRDFSTVRATPRLSFADLLLGDVGGQHRGLLLDVARRIWPRQLIRRLVPRCGLVLLIDAVK